MITAYERFLSRLEDRGIRYREGIGQTMALCPSHSDRDASLAIYRKPGKIKIVCYAGCDDALDILPALDLGVHDLWDEPRNNRSEVRPDPAILARIEARRSMTLIERALDDLLELPDIGERLARCIAMQGDGRD